MKKILKNFILLACFSLPFVASAQNKWLGELSLSTLDCEAKQVCYNVNIRGNTLEDWALGDQNYRLFFDAANVSVVSVQSFLPEGAYGKAQIREVLELANQGQEEYSPLDLIDENLGFLDFSIVAFAKENPAAAVKVSRSEPMAVAEVCFSVSDEMLEEGEENAMNIYFSRPETSGMITKQYSVISEIDGMNHTAGTSATAFSDINYNIGTDAQLAKICNSGSKMMSRDMISLYPNPVNQGGFINYDLKVAGIEGVHTISLYDVSGKIISVYEDLPEDNNRFQLDAAIASGTYYVKVKSESSVVNATFTVVE